LVNNLCRQKTKGARLRLNVYDEFTVQFFDDEHSAAEERFLTLGMSVGARLLLVCHCEREAGSVIRIISARKATRREQAFYGGDQR
jgi:uncharacterized protein